MTGALEVSNPSRQSRADQSAVLNLGRQQRIMDLTAMRAKVPMAAMLCNLHRHSRYLHLLKLSRRLVKRAHSAAAMRTAIHLVIHHPVNLCGRERLPFVTRVALLAADGTLFSRRQGRWRWFGNITGWRL